MKMISHMAWTEEGSRIVLKISQKSEIGDLVVQIATGHSREKWFTKPIKTGAVWFKTKTGGLN